MALPLFLLKFWALMKLGFIKVATFTKIFAKFIWSILKWTGVKIGKIFSWLNKIGIKNRGLLAIFTFLITVLTSAANLLPEKPKPPPEPPEPKPVPTKNQSNTISLERDSSTFHVSIIYRDDHWCSGSMICNRHVLTAAHCVHAYINDGATTNNYTVMANSKTVPDGKMFDVDKIFPHDSYVPEIKKNDVAVVRVKGRVTDKYIHLPKEGEKLQFWQELKYVGFGQVGNHMAHRIEMTIAVTRDKACRDLYGDKYSIGKFCATENPPYGIGQQDVGSPLISKNTTIMGILSEFYEAKDDDGNKKKGDTTCTYTFVPYYITFIKKAMGLP